jgi:hypothetical protein
MLFPLRLTPNDYGISGMKSFTGIIHDDTGAIILQEEY